jgi:folate-dependent phosphoribosylglycinamide formyltransferase PurN
MTATVHLMSAEKDTLPVFQVKNVNVELDTLKFLIHSSEHDLLCKTLCLLATGVCKC